MSNLISPSSRTSLSIRVVVCISKGHRSAVATGIQHVTLAKNQAGSHWNSPSGYITFVFRNLHWSHAVFRGLVAFICDG